MYLDTFLCLKDLETSNCSLSVMAKKWLVNYIRLKLVNGQSGYFVDQVKLYACPKKGYPLKSRACVAHIRI